MGIYWTRSIKEGDYNAHAMPRRAGQSGREAVKRPFLNSMTNLRFARQEPPTPSIMDPSYQLLTTETEYRQACDTVLGRAEHEILIFDRDLRAMQLDHESRLRLLSDFLVADSLRRIRVVLHDPGPLHREAPRLIRLIGRFSHLIDVRQSPDNLRHLADTHLIADEAQGVRRFHIDLPRSALILDDAAYIQPWRQRFEELWGLSHPCLQINTTGL
jgi:hypothetical protein